MTCGRFRFPSAAILVVTTTLWCACGSGDQRTLQRLGSAKADSASGNVADNPPAGDTARATVKRRTTSDLRVRVRDQDALDQRVVSHDSESDHVNESDDGGDPPPWARGHRHGHARGHPKGD